MNCKRILLILTLVTFVAFSVRALAAESTDKPRNDTNARIENLEQQISDLKASVESQSAPVPTYIKSKFPVELYGFVAAQVFWGSARTQLYTFRNDGNNYSFVAQSAVADKTLVSPDNAWIGITPQNSRIGLNWTGSKVSECLTMGGKLELDFLNPQGGASPRPRIRLFYLDLGGKNWVLRAGQEWDVFSPLNTNSLSLGGNLWFQGNLGFRRPQIRFTYTVPVDDTNSLKFVIAVNNPSNLDTIINSGNDSSVPYGDALIQYNRKMKSGDLIAGVSGIFGQNRALNRWSNVWGIAGSLAIPFHKYAQFSGEIQYGENLGDFLTYAGVSRRAPSLGGWAQLVSRWCDKLETTVGYGIDTVKKSYVTNNVVLIADMIDGIYRNQNVFANFKFYPVKPFYFGIEYNFMDTAYRGNGSSKASIVMTNLVYNF